MLALGVGEAAMAARGVALLSEGGAAAAEGGEEFVTLYRGVDALHPGYSNALNGIANPISGSASATEHVFLGNTASGLTSWTSEYAVAEGFATRESGAGVILSNAFPRSALIPSPGNAVGLGESEFLFRGPVTGAGVIPVP